jgi:hypothetical protein
MNFVRKCLKKEKKKAVLDLPYIPTKEKEIS